MRNLIVLICALTLCLCVTGCNSSYSAKGTNPNTEGTGHKAEPQELSGPVHTSHDEHSVKTEYQWDGGTIKGTVTNLTDDPLESVELDFELVDEHLMPLQRPRVKTTERIGPKGTWDFQVAANFVGAKQPLLKQTIVR